MTRAVPGLGITLSVGPGNTRIGRGRGSTAAPVGDRVPVFQSLSRDRQGLPVLSFA